ncbi:hypothetical protein PspLS_09489 [Pyricularia sp. CBS 133598]|nr:hypothetical protein PspLS_09489 [Pyricularia sp. CBS 133598]
MSLASCDNDSQGYGTMSGRVGEPGEPGLDVQARLRETSQAHG